MIVTKIYVNDKELITINKINETVADDLGKDQPIDEYIYKLVLREMGYDGVSTRHNITLKKEIVVNKKNLNSAQSFVYMELTQRFELSRDTAIHHMETIIDIYNASEHLKLDNIVDLYMNNYKKILKLDSIKDIRRLLEEL